MKIVQGLLIVAVAVAFTGCRKPATAADAAPVAVKVSTVELNQVSHGVRYSASIEPAKQVELAFKVGGYVEQLMQVRGVDGRLRDVQAGDRVALGAVLARVRQSDYAVKVNQAEAQSAEAKSALEASQSQQTEAQASVASSKAQLAEVNAAYEKARLDFDRAKTLFASQSSTKPELDAAQAQLDAATAKQNAARAQVAMLEARAAAAGMQIEISRARVKSSQAVVAEASIPLADTSLRAPLGGIVLQKSVETGALVSPGKPGFVVADTNSVKAIFGVPDLMLPKLKLGSVLTVTTESLPGEEFRGQLTRIAPAADSRSRVFDIEVTIPNPRQLLKPGMIAALEVNDAAPQTPMPVVPVSAIMRAKDRAGEYAVFVVEEKGGKTIARSRVVKLGEPLGNTVVVREGLNVGERVIVTGTSLTLDGQAVQIVP
ncbi:MAG TPA: efflux RND transporter periplasmic adaptor subunit [Blastocatellia bacterium]|nr:efflux RND transporter periplasmic adaptor subunit [Blastocatellia bacterium]HNG31106.1 efflux RND transporter periplasmic adaptor subunit [Blastocatellia bacterium]